MVLAMLRHLPEDALFTAHIKVDQDRERSDSDEPVEPDPELVALLDKKTWTEDRKLQAEISNRLGIILLYLQQWEKGKEPRLPIIGPEEWREVAEPKPKKLMTIDDVFAQLTRSE